MAECCARFIVWSAGRRIGKSNLAEALCLETSLTGGLAWWIVPTYNSAAGRKAWHLFLSDANSIPGAKINIAERRAVFPGGGVFELRSAEDPDSLRGDGQDLAIFDEASYIRPRAWTDCVRPGLMDRLGRAVFISTPKGQDWFWQLSRRGLDPGDPDWAFFTNSSYDNPYIPRSEIDDIAKDLPELVRRQEIFAEFIESGAGVFRRVLDAVRGDTLDAGLPGHRYVIGVDWARIRDFTVFAVCDSQERRCVRVDRMGNVDYGTQVMRLKELARKFPGSILAEENSMGGPLIERMQREGVPVRAWTTTNASKSGAVDALALAFERGDIGIPDDPVLIAELQAYESERLPGGLLRYSAPEGMHDDCVTALMIAWQGCARPTDTTVHAAGRPSIEESKWL